MKMFDSCTDPLRKGCQSIHHLTSILNRVYHPCWMKLLAQLAN